MDWRLKFINLMILIVSSLLLGQDTIATNLDYDQYVPQAVLSPSLDTLIIDNIYPGESRTFFLDLANLGDGMIELDRPQISGKNLTVALNARSIAPGQFVRFPVNYSQVGLQHDEIQIAIPWHSPRFKTDHQLTIVILPRPNLPIETTPESLNWLNAFTGQQVTTSLTLTNRAPSPVYFSQPTKLPENVRISTMPPVLAGGKSARINIVWTPDRPAVIAGQVNLNFVVDGQNQVFKLDYLGEVRGPLEIAPPMLDLGTIYAGSHYLRTFDISNNTSRAIQLRARVPDATLARCAGVRARRASSPTPPWAPRSPVPRRSAGPRHRAWRSW